MAEMMLPSDFLDLEAADLTGRVGDIRGWVWRLRLLLVYRIGDLWAVKLDMVIVESI